jgi:hypothetical protein
MSKIMIEEGRQGIGSDPLGRAWFSSAALARAGKALDDSGPVNLDKWIDVAACLVGEALGSSGLRCLKCGAAAVRNGKYTDCTDAACGLRAS